MSESLVRGFKFLRNVSWESFEISANKSVTTCAKVTTCAWGWRRPNVRGLLCHCRSNWPAIDYPNAKACFSGGGGIRVWPVLVRLVQSVAANCGRLCNMWPIWTTKRPWHPWMCTTQPTFLHQHQEEKLHTSVPLAYTHNVLPPFTPQHSRSVKPGSATRQTFPYSFHPHFERITKTTVNTANWLRCTVTSMKIQSELSCHLLLWIILWINKYYL